MGNTSFNSNYGFDLGNISNILISGASSTADQVLVLKSDATGKFRLEPQALNSVGSTNSITVTPTSGSSYYKKEVFSNSMTNTTTFGTLKSYNFNIGTSKTKLYLTVKMDLMAQGTIGSVFQYYHFTTGYNIVSDTNGSGNFIFRHIPGHFSYIFNKGSGANNSTIAAIGSDKQFQNFASIPTVSNLVLQPKFSTITTPLDSTIIANYPKIIHSINTGNTNSTTDDTLNLTIQGRSIRSSENIEWFGTVEFFASIA